MTLARALVLALPLLATASPTHADPAADPVGAIYAASALHGVAPAPLIALAWCESRWRPDARGDHGRSLGLFQLSTLPTGLHAHFLAQGYRDADDPEQSSDYVARVAAGRWAAEGITLRRWTCAR